jgi:hypothetical protein
MTTRDPTERQQAEKKLPEAQNPSAPADALKKKPEAKQEVEQPKAPPKPDGVEGKLSFRDQMMKSMRTAQAAMKKRMSQMAEAVKVDITKKIGLAVELVKPSGQEIWAQLSKAKKPIQSLGKGTAETVLAASQKIKKTVRGFGDSAAVNEAFRNGSAAEPLKEKFGGMDGSGFPKIRTLVQTLALKVRQKLDGVANGETTASQDGTALQGGIA